MNDGSAQSTRHSRILNEYLRRIGETPLLSREGEVELARRIELGEQGVIDAILESSFGLREFMALSRGLEEGLLRVEDILLDEDDEPLDDALDARQRLYDIFDEARRSERKVRDLERDLRRAENHDLADDL